MARSVRHPLLLALALAGCKAGWPLEGNAGCDHAGYAVASRIQACTGDPDAANAAYLAFRKQTTCLLDGNKPVAADFDCSIDLADLDCKAVEAAGEDWAAWLGGTRCDAILDWDGALQDTGGAR